MKQAYLDLDIIRLSGMYETAHLDKQFILLDNFDEVADEDDTDILFVNHPTKISFTIAIFLSGRTDVVSNQLAGFRTSGQ